MQSAPTAFQSYVPNLSMDGRDRRASKHVTARQSQTAVALGALAAASVAAGAGFYFWPSGEQQGEAYEAEELPMTGVLLGDHPVPPGPSISFSHPLVPPDEVPLRAKQAGLRSVDRDGPASRSRHVPASGAAATGRETGGQELAQAITREPPTAPGNRLPSSAVFKPMSRLDPAGWPRHWRCQRSAGARGWTPPLQLLLRRRMPASCQSWMGSSPWTMERQRIDCRHKEAQRPAGKAR